MTPTPTIHLGKIPSAIPHQRGRLTIGIDSAIAKMSSKEKAQTKKFQKGERVIPASTDKALKYYPAEDEAVAKKVCRSKFPMCQNNKWSFGNH